MKGRGVIACCTAAAMLALPIQRAAAGEAAAIVEDVKGAPAGIRFMDYLEAGRVVDLGTSGRIVLGYLRSCEHEVIKGGEVTIGAKQSVVRGGSLKRERVECDGGRLILQPEEADKGAVMVFRRPPGVYSAQSSLTIYDVSPLFKVTNGARRVEIARIDLPEDPIAADVVGGIVDLARRHVKLARGGLYRASAGASSIVFRVDRYAAASSGSIVSRLIHF